MYLFRSFIIFIPRHTIVVGYYGFTLAVGVPICLSMCAYVRLLSVRPLIFSFPDDNLRKYQWIFMELNCYVH